MDARGSVLGQKSWEMTEAGAFDKDVHKYALTPRDLHSRADIKAQKYSRNTEKSETLWPASHLRFCSFSLPHLNSKKK